MRRKISDYIKNNIQYSTRARDFEKDYIKVNHNRATVILSVLYFVEWLIYFNSNKFLGIGNIVFALQAALTVLIPLLIISNIKFNLIPLYLHKLLLLACMFVLQAFGIALVFYTTGQADLTHMFLLTSMAVGTVVYMPLKFSAAVIGIPTIIFAVGLSVFQTNVSVVAIAVWNTVIFNTLILLLSYSLFLMKIRDYIMTEELQIQNEELQKQAQIDKMTSLYNHETIISLLSQEIELSKRHQKKFVIMLLDIDDFKEINDRFGHLEGDIAIKKVSLSIKQAVRASDYVGRYGGEEFLIIMPESTLDGAISAYDRMNALIDEKLSDQQMVLTISCGLAEYEGQDINDLLRIADRRLYIAKRTGKNKCIDSECQLTMDFSNSNS